MTFFIYFLVIKIELFDNLIELVARCYAIGKLI